MADAMGADFTSSMTSVTEEDGSLSESDTCNSNFSSSLLNSTDYNTDDKLTPSLNSISISKGAHKIVRKFANGGKVEEVDRKSQCTRDNRTLSSKHAFAHPFDAKSSSLVQKGVSNKKYQKKNQCETFASDCEKTRKADLASKVKSLNKSDWNPFTFDYPDHYLYTDFTNNNNANGAEIETEEEDEDSEVVEDDSDSGRFFLPDMDSPSWYTAQIFDRYWIHYNFAMDWFSEHVKFVNAQYRQSFSVPFQSGYPPHYRMKSNSKERQKKRARKRRATRAKHKQKADCDEEAAPDENQSGNQEEETIIEMEITEDMMEFFSQSFKHRLERDKQKVNERRQEEESTRIDIEQTLAGQQGPTTTAPKERPGVRRTAEMKLLYGQGAAMIHGMETALQMTFDKFSDRHQPKLWPNMPLKMCFT